MHACLEFSEPEFNMGNLSKSVMSVQCSKRTACLTGKGMGVVNLPELSNLLVVFFFFFTFSFSN